MIISQHGKPISRRVLLFQRFHEIEDICLRKSLKAGLEPCSSSIIKHFVLVIFSYKVKNIGILCVGIVRSGV